MSTTKNNEDPANFILRLKSLKKALPNDDLARSSNNSIPQNSEKSIEKSKLSLSPEDGDIAPVGKYNVYGKDVAYTGEDIGPVRADISQKEETALHVHSVELVNKNADDHTVGTQQSGQRHNSSSAEKVYHNSDNMSRGSEKKTDDIGPVREDIVTESNAERDTGEEPSRGSVKRKDLHKNIIDNIKATFEEKGYDLDKVLKKAKNLSTFSTVDNTPQSVMEKSLGYKEGGILADLTVNRVVQNETEGIKWLNSFTDRKNGLASPMSIMKVSTSPRLFRIWKTILSQMLKMKSVSNYHRCLWILNHIEIIQMI